MPTGLIVALGVLALIAATVLLYELYFKGKKTSLPKISLPNITNPIQPKPSEAIEVVLEDKEIEKLFDIVLPNYIKQIPEGTIVADLVIKGVGAWTVDTVIKSINRQTKENALGITLSDGLVFNELITQKEFSKPYLMGLALSGKVKAKGDYNKLAGMEPFLKVLVANKEKIIAESQI